MSFSTTVPVGWIERIGGFIFLFSDLGDDENTTDFWFHFVWHTTVVYGTIIHDESKNDDLLSDLKKQIDKRNDDKMSFLISPGMVTKF